MAGIKALVALAFSGSIGLLFLFLACALPQFNVWWPLFVLIFYFLAPVPSLLSRRMSDDGMGGASSALKEVCYFFTTGIVLSAFALPIVLSRVGAIHGGACALVITGNIVMFTTIWGFFKAFDHEDGFEYSTW
jgi:hypothetical protein